MPEQPLGLRERKKLRTRAAIQREAMRLFLEKGFDATTVDEIAAAADISPSTFFNYFPTKEDVVLTDDLDPLILDAFNRQAAGLSPVAAMRRAMSEVFSAIPPEEAEVVRERVALMAREEGLRAAMLSQFASLIQEIAELIAQRDGRDPGDFRVRNLAGAVMGVMMASILAAADDPKADFLGLAERGLDHLEAGLPLD